MGKGISTIGTVLKAGATAGNLTKLCKIKSYPQLMGAPENLETTDLEDTAQTFTPGVQSVDQMEFTANYTKEAFISVKALEGSELFYQLEMGAGGAEGIFTWKGTHSVYVNSGDVNAVREMTIVVTPSTIISGPTGATGATN